MLLSRLARPCLRSLTTAAPKMQIELGERIPTAIFKSLELAEDGCTTGKPKDISTAELFAKKTVVLVAVPGAYTPTVHLNMYDHTAYICSARRSIFPGS